MTSPISPALVWAAMGSPAPCTPGIMGWDGTLGSGEGKQPSLGATVGW